MIFEIAVYIFFKFSLHRVFDWKVVKFFLTTTTNYIQNESNI